MLNCREFDCKSRALASPIGLCPDCAAVGFDYLLGDEETVAGGVDVGLDGFCPMAAFGKEPLHVFLGNTHSAVFDGERDFFATV